MNMPFGGFNFIDPDDPEVKAAIVRQTEEAKTQQIKGTLMKQTLTDMMKNLSQDELTCLGSIFGSIANGHADANFFLGLVNGSLALRFETCPICSKNHKLEVHHEIERALKEAAAERDDESKPNEFPVVNLTEEIKAMGRPRQLELAFDEASQAYERVVNFDYDLENPTELEMNVIQGLAQLTPEMPLSDRIKTMAEQYNLDDAWEDLDLGGKRFLGWVCLNCKKMYPSIQDRAMKPADKAGCPGCVNKEKWG